MTYTGIGRNDLLDAPSTTQLGCFIDDPVKMCFPFNNHPTWVVNILYVHNPQNDRKITQTSTVVCVNFVD